MLSNIRIKKRMSACKACISYLGYRGMKWQTQKNVARSGVLELQRTDGDKGARNCGHSSHKAGAPRHPPPARALLRCLDDAAKDHRRDTRRSSMALFLGQTSASIASERRGGVLQRAHWWSLQMSRARRSLTEHS